MRSCVCETRCAIAGENEREPRGCPGRVKEDGRRGHRRGQDAAGLHG